MGSALSVSNVSPAIYVQPKVSSGNITITEHKITGTMPTSEMFLHKDIIWGHFFPILNAFDLLSFSLVCKQFYMYLSETMVWKLKVDSVALGKSLTVKELKKMALSHYSILYPECDTFIWGESLQNLNMPAYTKNELKAYQLHNRKILMRFDLSDYQNYLSCHLNLLKKWDGTEHGHYGSNMYEIHVVENNWDDNTTWNSQPNVSSGIPFLSVCIGRAYKWYQLDITSLIQSCLHKKKKKKHITTDNNTSSKTYNNFLISIRISAKDNGSLSAFWANECSIQVNRPFLKFKFFTNSE